MIGPRDSGSRVPNDRANKSSLVNVANEHLIRIHINTVGEDRLPHTLFPDMVSCFLSLYVHRAAKPDLDLGLAGRSRARNHLLHGK